MGLFRAIKWQKNGKILSELQQDQVYWINYWVEALKQWLLLKHLASLGQEKLNSHTLYV